MKASVSKVNVVNRCLKKYEYRYIENLQRVKQNPKPLLGVIGHKCLELFYTGKDWTTPLIEYQAEVDKMLDEEKAIYGSIIPDLSRILKGYFLNYRTADAGFKVLAAELPFKVPTPGGNEYEGRIDLIIEDSDGVWVWDNKFVKTIPDETVRYLDAQTNLYYYAAERMGYKPIGVIFNYLRTKAPTQPTILKAGTVSKAAIDTDVLTYATAIKNAGLNIDDYKDMLEKLRTNYFYRRFKVPRPVKLLGNILQEFDMSCQIAAGVEVAKTYPRCLTKDCSWDCEYANLCMAELTGINSDFIRKSEYEVKEREVKEDGGEETSD